MLCELNETLQPFTTLGNLEYVRIMGKLTPYLYRGLETMLLVRCPNLIKLNISIELCRSHGTAGYHYHFFTILYTDENADMSTMFANPAAWPHLTRLTIHGFALDCATYLAFLEGHSLLEELHTDWKLGIDTLDFRKLAPTALPHLQSFTFEHLDSTIAMHLLGHSRPLRRIGKFTMTEKTQPVDLFFAKLAECAPGLEALEIDFSGPQTRVLRSIVEIVSDTLVWLNLGDNSGKRAAVCDLFTLQFTALEA